MQVSFEIIVQIKQKRGIGVETPSQEASQTGVILRNIADDDPIVRDDDPIVRDT